MNNAQQICMSHTGTMKHESVCNKTQTLQERVKGVQKMLKTSHGPASTTTKDVPASAWLARSMSGSMVRTMFSP